MEWVCGIDDNFLQGHFATPGLKYVRNFRVKVPFLSILSKQMIKILPQLLSAHISFFRMNSLTNRSPMTLVRINLQSDHYFEWLKVLKGQCFLHGFLFMDYLLDFAHLTPSHAKKF